MALPQRLAGTCNKYSKNAMPQLATMTISNGLFLNFKWPYHANVMKTFEQVSRTTGSQRDWRREFMGFILPRARVHRESSALRDEHVVRELRHHANRRE